MTKKKIFIILAAVLLFATVLSAAIPISRMFFRPLGRQEVLTPEHAIQIAKAAITQRYGEAEIEGMEFYAFLSRRRHSLYWRVSEGSKYDARYRLGYWPVVFVRMSDGMVIMQWRDNVITRIVERVPFG